MILYIIQTRNDDNLLKFPIFFILDHVNIHRNQTYTHARIAWYASNTKVYTEVLNFTCDVKLDDLTWLTLRKDEIEIMFCSPNKHHNIPKSIMSGLLYINTNEVTTHSESVKDQCEICYPLEDFDYGMREFAIYDNNGYSL